MSERNEVMWCTLCGARFTQSEIQGWGCPKCGNKGVPCATEKDVLVEINWHELHILCCWAENYAASIDSRNEDTKPTKTVHAIARRLQNQHPAMGHLTLSGEIASLPADAQKHGIEISAMEKIGIGDAPLIPVNGPGAVGHSKRSKP